MKTTSIIIKASRSLCGAGALALLVTASAAQAELIANGTFEAVSGGNGSNATSWTKDNGAYGVYNEPGRPGPYAGSWSYVPGNGYANSGVYQTLGTPLQSGRQYSLSWYQNPWFANNGLDVIVGVYSGSGARDVAGSYSSVSLDVDVTDTTANTWTFHTYTFTAVGNSTSVYFGTLTSAGRGDSADIDNVSLIELPPGTPTGLTATPAAGQVALIWTASTGATGYNVKRSTTSGAEVQIATASGTTYSDNSVTNGTTYYYVVSATNDVGESADSTEVSATPLASKGEQTITFTLLGASATKNFGDTPFADTATASSGLPVTYSSDHTDVATVDASGTVTIVAAGTAHILADQAGNESWNPAPQASQTLTVNKGNQTIAFALGSNVIKLPTAAPFADTATASSGLPVTYSSDTESVATVDADGTVTLMGTVGTAHILADQAGDANWNAAPQASQTLTVNKGNQTIAFALGSNVIKLPTAAPFDDTATASSGLPVTYSSDTESVATVDASGTVTLMGTVGTAHILADQAGDANWNAAPQVSQELMVTTELISNGGFETNTGANAGNATGWTKDGGAYGVFNELLYGRTGAHAGSWAYVPGNGASTTVGVYQTLASPLVAGQRYTLSFYQNPWAASNGNDVRVGKYNSGSRDSDGSYSPLPLSVMSVSTVAAGDWELKSYTFTAVGGENTVYFGTAIAGNNNGADIDDVSLTAVATVGYAYWATTQGLTGGPGSDLDPAFTADPNKDGIQNGMAWILGAGALGDPAANLLKLPAVSRDETGALVLIFDRLVASEASAPLVVQYSDDLGATPWTELAVGASGGTDGNITIAVATGGGLTGTDYDRVTVTIPATYMAAHPKTFARLKAAENP